MSIAVVACEPWLQPLDPKGEVRLSGMTFPENGHWFVDTVSPC
jgi:hypothetical protein